MLFDNNIQNDFVKSVEKYVGKNGGTYIDAILHMCELFEVEPQIAAKFLSQPIIEKVGVEGIDINILKENDAKLPI
jgi:kynurenine formamidase